MQEFDFVAIARVTVDENNKLLESAVALDPQYPLEPKAYVTPDGIPNKDAIMPLLCCFINGITGTIEHAKQIGYEMNEVQLMEFCVERLGESFATHKELNRAEYNKLFKNHNHELNRNN